MALGVGSLKPSSHAAASKVTEMAFSVTKNIAQHNTKLDTGFNVITRKLRELCGLIRDRSCHRFDCSCSHLLAGLNLRVHAPGAAQRTWVPITWPFPIPVKVYNIYGSTLPAQSVCCQMS